MSGFLSEPHHGRRLDTGDTVALFLTMTIIFVAVCAFLGWYSRRRG